MVPNQDIWKSGGGTFLVISMTVDTLLMDNDMEGTYH